MSQSRRSKVSSTLARLSPDGRYIASAGGDATILMVDIQTRERWVVLRGPEGTYATEVAFAGTTGGLVASFSDGWLRRVDTRSSSVDAWQTGDSMLYSVAASPNGRDIVSAGASGDAKVWRVGETSSPRLVLPARRGGVLSVAFSPTGSQIATGELSGLVGLSAAEDGRLVSEFQASEQYIFAVSYSADATKIVTASEDGAVVLWSSGGDRMVTLLGHDGSVYDAYVSPRSGRIVTAGRDSDVRIWDSGDLIIASAPVTKGRFNSDSSRVVMGGTDGQIRIW